MNHRTSQSAETVIGHQKSENASPVCDHCDETIDLTKDKYARNEIPTCIPYCAELEGYTCENCRERAYDRYIESFYG